MLGEAIAKAAQPVNSSEHQIWGSDRSSLLPIVQPRRRRNDREIASKAQLHR